MPDWMNIDVFWCFFADLCYKIHFLPWGVSFIRLARPDITTKIIAFHGSVFDRYMDSFLTAESMELSTKHVHPKACQDTGAPPGGACFP